MNQIVFIYIQFNELCIKLYIKYENCNIKYSSLNIFDMFILKEMF